MGEKIKNILKELKQRQTDFEDPGSYMEVQWYIKCKAKAEAFEEAIGIVQRIVNGDIQVKEEDENL